MKNGLSSVGAKEYASGPTTQEKNSMNLHLSKWYPSFGDEEGSQVCISGWAQCYFLVPSSEKGKLKLKSKK